MTKDDAIKAIEGKRVPEADGFPDRDMSQSYNLALDHAIEAIRALPDAGWRGIESAPAASQKENDNLRVLVIGGIHTEATIILADGEWWRLRANQSSKAVPTHWMPLPPPPEKA